MGGITTAITTLQSELLTIVVPIAVVSVILWFIANALAPVLPEWAQGMRGHFQKVMIGVMLVGGATTIITAFYGMLGGGAAGEVGVLATLEVGGLAFYERVTWAVRGTIARRATGERITPEQLIGAPTVG